MIRDRKWMRVKRPREEKGVIYNIGCRAKDESLNNSYRATGIPGDCVREIERSMGGMWRRG